MAGKIQNEDIKSSADLISAGGSPSQLPNDTKIWCTANGINDTLYNSILNGLLGGGGAGGINFLTLDSLWKATKSNNMTAENSLGDWSAKQDATTNTTGTPNISISRTTSGGEVLDGAASFKVSKGAANYQYEGVGCPAYIPPGYRGQVLTFTVPFKVLSGSIVQGDLFLYAYDVTNSKMLNLNNRDVVINNGILSGTFPVSNTTAQIIFGFYFASTSTNAVDFSFDDVFVTAVGAPFLGMTGTDWEEYDLVIGAVTTPPTEGTGVQKKYRWKRDGGDMLIQGSYYQLGGSGNTGVGAYLWPIPEGYEIDDSKVNVYPVTSNPGNILMSVVGQTNTYVVTFSQRTTAGLVIPYDTKNLVLTGNYQNGSENVIGGAGGAYTCGLDQPTTMINFYARVPIKGWSTGLLTQNTGPFSLASVLANGTRVVGTPPTKLGEYRSFLRQANTASFTEVNGTPSTLPTISDGIKIWSAGNFTSGDPSNQPSAFQAFIGFNKSYKLTGFQSAGKSGSLDISKYCDYANNTIGLEDGYDPNTGILTVNVSTDNTPLYVGRFSDPAANTGVAPLDGYWDAMISSVIIPVQPVQLKPRIVKYTADATYVVPEGLAYTKWRFTGGGGGGGSSTASGGGGSAAYCEMIADFMAPGTSVPIVMGLGAGATGNGTDTVVSFPSGAVTAGGGFAGASVGGAPATAVGGAGGTVTGAPADAITIDGQYGGTGFGSSGIGYMGYGGSTPYFGGGGRNGCYPSNGASGGTAPGAGGGGGYTSGAGGHDGIVIIEEYYYL